jgi:hypothetical protein
VTRKQRLLRRLDGMTVPLSIYAVNRGMKDWLLHSPLARGKVFEPLQPGQVVFDEASSITPEMLLAAAERLGEPNETTEPLTREQLFRPIPLA